MKQIRSQDLIHRWVVFTNNYCNLHCQECSAFCDKPFGYNNFRDKKWDIKLLSLEMFLNGLPNKQYSIRLTGGEPTAMDNGHLEDVLNMIHEKGHLPSITTNCYGIMNISDEVFEKIYHLDLDNHGYNLKAFNDAKNRAEAFGVEYRVLNVPKHYIMKEAISASQGRGCNNWIHLPGLYKGVVYPCSNSMLHFGGDLALRKELVNEGLIVSNTAWWRFFQKLKFSKRAHENCLYGCWVPGCREATWVPLTQKPNDVIQKPMEVEE